MAETLQFLLEAKSELRAAIADLREFRTSVLGVTQAAGQPRIFDQYGRALDDTAKKTEDVAKKTAGLTTQKSLLDQGIATLTRTLARYAGPVALGFAIKNTIAYADTLTKLSDRTGIGVQALQRLENIAIVSGNTLDQLAGSVNQLQRRMASGDAALVKAFDSLNLSVHTLRGLAPDQQFIEIATALNRVKDPADFVNLSFAVFGRSASEILPTIRADVQRLASGMVTMSDAGVKAWDELGDAVARFWLNVKRLTGEGLVFLAGLRKAPLPTPPELIPGLERLIRPKAPQLIPSVPLPTFQAPDFTLLDQIFGTTAEQQARLAKTAEAIRKVEEANEKFRESVRQINPLLTSHARIITTEVGVSYHQTFLGLMPTMTERVQAFRAEIATLGRELLLTTRSFAGLSGQIPLPTVTPSGRVGEALAPSILSTFGKTFSTQLGPTLLSAFTGGGNVTQSVGALAGGQLASSIMTSLTKEGGKLAGSAMGSILGSVLPGVGTLLGGLAGKLFGGLFGKSKTQKENEAAQGQIEALKQKLIETYGSLENIRQIGDQVGFSLADAFGHKGKKGLEIFREQIKDFEERNQRLQTALERYGLTWEDLGIKARQSQIDALSKELIADWGALTTAGIDVEKVAQRMSGAVNEFLATAVRTGTEVPTSMRPMLEKMVEMGLLTDESGNKLENLEHIPWATTLTQGFSSIVDRLDELLVGLGIKAPAEFGKFGERARVEGAGFREVVDGMSARFQDFADRGIGGGRARIIDQFRSLGPAAVEASDEIGQAFRKPIRIPVDFDTPEFPEIRVPSIRVPVNFDTPEFPELRVPSIRVPIEVEGDFQRGGTVPWTPGGHLVRVAERETEHILTTAQLAGIVGRAMALAGGATRPGSVQVFVGSRELRDVTVRYVNEGFANGEIRIPPGSERDRVF